jgi:prophage regulatory protein
MTWKSNLKPPSSGDAPGRLRFLREPEVLNRVGVTWITILRWEQEGTFPPRRKIGKRVVAWVEAEIDEWCAGKAAETGGEGQ